MRYKKALALMVGIGTLFAGSAFAKKGMGGPMVPPVDQAKLQEFCKDAQPLYQRESQLRLETRFSCFSRNQTGMLSLRKSRSLLKFG
jgi:hypothetical protein